MKNIHIIWLFRFYECILTFNLFLLLFHFLASFIYSFVSGVECLIVMSLIADGVENFNMLYVIEQDIIKNNLWLKTKIL